MSEERPSHPRGYPVFRPHWEERPTRLLEQQFESEEELNWVRVAKHNNCVIAAYAIAPLDRFHYKIRMLVVDECYRGEGLGRWLLLHALGLIESKGGQFVYANWGCRTPLLEAVGFEHGEENEYRIKLERE